MKTTSIKTPKLLKRYLDKELVHATQARLRRASSDRESFGIITEFGSNAFGKLLAKAGINTYGKFVDFNAEQLNSYSGIGTAKIEEFKLARRFFSCGSRRVVPLPPSENGEDQKEKAPPDFDDVPRANHKVPEWRLKELGTKCCNIILSLRPKCRAGDVAGLTRKELLAKKNCGMKRADEIMKLVEACRDGSVWTPTGILAIHAKNFGSLSDMLLKTVAVSIPLNDICRAIMHLYLGLLDATKRTTLEETGKRLGLTHERVRQLANRILSALRTLPLSTGLSDLATCAGDCFGSGGKEMSETDFTEAMAAKLSWKKVPTPFSLQNVLKTIGFEIVVNPKTGLLAWNKNGNYNWIVTYKPPTATSVRRSLIKSVLQEAGPEGLTMSEIIARCKKKNASIDIGVGNVRGCSNPGNDLDSAGTRMIGIRRGKRGGEGTTYSLNTFFSDEATEGVLKNAGEEVRQYMECTGFGIVDVWKIWRKYRHELPAGTYLPKLGFYMMMRDIGAGGLCYKDYPRISYDGIDVGKNAYWWELYEYFHLCGHPKASFGQIMSFFVDCLGIQPNVALSCAFNSMGLKKDDEATDAPYVIKRPPAIGKAPIVLLKTVVKDEKLSLIKADGKSAIHSDYFDETGHAIYHPTYVKVFLRNLENTDFAFTSEEIAQLADVRWCKKHLKIPRPMLRKADRGKPAKGTGYWFEKFVFGDESFYVCDDWNQTTKAAFDNWAINKAKQAGFAFTPYEVGIANEEEDE